MTVQAQQFRGILNNHPVAIGLFREFVPGQVYLFEVTAYVNDDIYGDTCQVTIIDEAKSISRTATFPSAYLKDLFIPFTSPAAKILFGKGDQK